MISLTLSTMSWFTHGTEFAEVVPTGSSQMNPCQNREMRWEEIRTGGHRLLAFSEERP